MSRRLAETTPISSNPILLPFDPLSATLLIPSIVALLFPSTPLLLSTSFYVHVTCSMYTSCVYIYIYIYT